ncbi:MAG: hypothetical protein IT379_14090 [Deltaproteobacteria bacterium]|nr:hypothetical protein [Deltaproteobacteria bacterium]
MTSGWQPPPGGGPGAWAPGGTPTPPPFGGGTPPPPGTTPPPQQPRVIELPAAPPKSRAGTVVTYGCLGLLFLCCMAGGLAYYAYWKTRPPVDSAHAFLGHVRNGNLQDAWRWTTPQYQAVVPYASFPIAIDQVPALRQSTDARFDKRRIDESGTTACLEGVLHLSSGTVPIFVLLAKESGYWRVHGFSSSPMQGCPASP